MLFAERSGWAASGQVKVLTAPARAMASMGGAITYAGQGVDSLSRIAQGGGSSLGGPYRVSVEVMKLVNDDLTLTVAVRRAIAQATDQDYVGQIEVAVRAMMALRPDMTASGALHMVRRLRPAI